MLEQSIPREIGPVREPIRTPGLHSETLPENRPADAPHRGSVHFGGVIVSTTWAPVSGLSSMCDFFIERRSGSY